MSLLVITNTTLLHNCHCKEIIQEYDKRMRKALKRLLWAILILFIIINIVAYFHAYKFTHFSSSSTDKTESPKDLSFGQKLVTLFFGVKNPRPENKAKPKKEYETITLNSNKNLECWLIEADSAKGTVILFHGYSSEKSAMLNKAEIFLNIGYNTFLVDFMGSGGSEGNRTSIGYDEAEQVKTAFEFIKERGEENIVLYGSSMGSVAIMKAEIDYALNPVSIILECPFGTMLKTVKSRFHAMNLPSFPMAHLLVFWGGIQNGFNGFGHNPVNYAKRIKCPVLLLYGEKDDKVSYDEINEIYNNIILQRKDTAFCKLVIFPEARHEDDLSKYKIWKINIKSFFQKQLN